MGICLSIISPRTGSEEPFGNDGCNTGIGDPVVWASTSWTRRVEGDDYEPIGGVDGTTDSAVCISKPGELAIWDSVLSRPRPGPLSRMAMVVVIPDPIYMY